MQKYREGKKKKDFASSGCCERCEGDVFLPDAGLLGIFMTPGVLPSSAVGGKIPQQLGHQESLRVPEDEG